MKVPFVDLSIQYNSIKNEIETVLEQVFTSCTFIRGKQTQVFEKHFAKLHGVKHAIAVGNGTDALFLSLKSIGLEKGDEVITTASSWISSSETISHAGGIPVFVDVNEHNLIDVEKIEDAITENTKAILPVHLYGRSCNLSAIKKICETYHLFLIEDCAQAVLAEHNGRKVGTYGNYGAFSFYPSKNLGAYGDAGCIITNNDEYAESVRRLANHGAISKHDHLIEGFNSRIDELQAGILTVKLKHLVHWTEKRINLAKQYTLSLKNIPQINIPHEPLEHMGHVYHLYVIETEKRDDLKQYLEEKGISTSIHYPSALPFLDAYSVHKYKSSCFPLAWKKQKKVLSLPLFPELKEEQVNYVCAQIKEFFK